jgi:hypothetical protein
MYSAPPTEEEDEDAVEAVTAAEKEDVATADD